MKKVKKVVTDKTVKFRGRGIGTIESDTLLSEFSQKVSFSTIFSNRASFLPGDPQNGHFRSSPGTESVYNVTVLTL